MPVSASSALAQNDTYPSSSRKHRTDGRYAVAARESKKRELPVSKTQSAAPPRWEAITICGTWFGAGYPIMYRCTRQGMEIFSGMSRSCTEVNQCTSSGLPSFDVLTA